MKIGKDTESYNFFERIWEVGKYSNKSENKDFYLNVGIEILECLKTHTYEELKLPLNEFYKYLGNIPNDNEINNVYNNELKNYDDKKINLLCQKVIELSDNLIERYNTDKSICNMLQKCTMLVINNFNNRINDIVKEQNSNIKRHIQRHIR